MTRPNGNTSRWTEKDVELLRQLWAQGLSCSRIAAALHFETGASVSRCAVIGKAHRLGLPPRSREEPGGPKPRMGRARGMPKLVSHALPPVPLTEPEYLGPINDFPDGKVCRYPRGEMHKDFQCCAQPGYPYCEYHHARVFNSIATAASFKKAQRDPDWNKAAA